MALCGLLGASARQSIVAAALKVEEMALANALDGLEAFGYVQCEDGVLRASGLMADAAKGRVKRSILRIDNTNASPEVDRVWAGSREPQDFYTSVRLRIEAANESHARSFLDAETGVLVRIETAPALLFEFRLLRRSAATHQLQQLLDITIEQVLEGSESKRPGVKARVTRVHPISLPSVSPTAVEKHYTLATKESLAQSQQASRDPSLSPARRLCEAVEAMLVASNTDDNSSFVAAYSSVNSVRFSAEINPFDLHRADLMFHTTFGDRVRALTSAELLLAEARVVADVSLACKGYRNAAEAFVSFGLPERAQAVLLESRALATRLGYATSEINADFRLADLGILSMDAVGAKRYLDSAQQTMNRYALRVPILYADFFFLSCWAAIIAGDPAEAAKASRGMVRTLRGKHLGTAHTAIAGTRLATQIGKPSTELKRDFMLIRDSLVNRTHDSNIEYSLAAIILFARRQKLTEEVSALTAVVFDRMETFGRRPWPFITQLIAGDSHATLPVFG